MNAKEKLLIKVLNEGSINGDVLKVDRFLNHQVDTEIIESCALEIAENYADTKLDLVLSVETGGVILGPVVAEKLALPFVYARKRKPFEMADCYEAESYSFTKREQTRLYVLKEFLEKDMNVLFVDDFYARGSTLLAVEKILNKAEANLKGAAVIVNKSERKDVFCIADINDIRSLIE